MSRRIQELMVIAFLALGLVAVSQLPAAGAMPPTAAANAAAEQPATPHVHADAPQLGNQPAHRIGSGASYCFPPTWPATWVENLLRTSIRKQLPKRAQPFFDLYWHAGHTVR